MKSFADFEVWIRRTPPPNAGGQQPKCEVRVFSSPAGTAVGELKLDPQDPTFKTALVEVSGINPNLPRRTEVGQKLFSAIFNDDVLNAWANSWGRVDGGAADGLRLRLFIEDEALSFLSWELLHDPIRGFLAASVNGAVSRYLPVQEPPLAVHQKPLRILVIVESPKANGLAPIPEAEQLSLKKELDAMGNAVSHLILLNPSIEKIQDELRKDPHVIHFLGHGTSSKVVLVMPDDQLKVVSDNEFATLFLGRRSVRLVVLNACSSSKSEDGDLFSGMGPALVRAGLPAVVAMQYPTVQLESAGIFSRAMYRSLADGLPVDIAVNEGRNLLAVGQDLGSRDWSTPVLYLGTRSGRILDFETENKEVVQKAWQNIQGAARESGALSALTQLSQRFKELAERHRMLPVLMEAANELNNLRVAYSALSNLLDEAGGNPAGLAFGNIRLAWTSFHNDHWLPFVVFVDGHEELKTSAWYVDLLQQHDAVAGALQNIHYGALHNGLTSYRESLSQAAASLRLHLEKTIDSIISFSDQTLPLLTVED
jgi:hypothetical protein